MTTTEGHPDEPSEKTVPVVGIGASAGGLGAFRELLQNLPHDTGFAFVLVQHLDPTHESLMADLLSKHTRMPVKEVQDDARIQRDHVYIIPPDAFLAIRDDRLKLEPTRTSRGVRLAVDHFFKSLAEDRGKRSIGIVLSGTGSDGTAGMRFIRAHGGLTIAQLPETAEHDGMPRSAVDADVVDLALPIAEVPEALKRFSSHPYLREPLEDDRDSDQAGESDEITAIAALLKTRSNFDGSPYKIKTVTRRIRRRMGLRHVETYSDYLAILRAEDGEVEALIRDLLISVTEFFRDPETYEYLCDEVFPAMVENAADTPIRLWVCACATGEEAYSLTMCLLEEIRRQERAIDLQVFATDVDENALSVARAGVYAESALQSVSQPRIDSYFVKLGGNRYRVSSEVRDCISFATHNIVRDAPFSKMHLISCRNLMIYLKRDVQIRVLGMFHFALRPDGTLLLGSAESPAVDRSVFSTMSKEHRVFRRAGHGRPLAAQFPPYRAPTHSASTAHEDTRPPRTREIAPMVLLESCSIAGVVVERNGDVLYLHGPIERYLDLPRGEMQRDLFSMLRGQLRTRVRAALYRALRSEEAVDIRCKSDAGSDSESVLVRIAPSSVRSAQGLFSVVFESSARASSEKVATGSGENDDSLVSQLEQELETVREELRTTLEELETSNEELKASNEEAMSMNEELQSSNEELEASTEELRSLNEELTTVNHQLRERVSELQDASNDLSNFFSSTKLATVFLDRDLLIKRFTPSTSRLLGLRDDDTGRTLAPFLTRIDPNFDPEARKVLDDLRPRTEEIRTDDGLWLRRAILPYRTLENKISGVVVTFSDITDLKVSVDGLTTRVKQQETTARFGRHALEENSSLDRTLELAPVLLAETLGIEFAKVLEYLPDEDSLLLRSGVGWNPGLVGSATVPAGTQSQGGFTFATEDVVMVDDLHEEKRFSGPQLLIDHQVRSGMSCVIRSPDGPWGVLGVHSIHVKTFTDDDADFLYSIANIISSAVQREKTLQVLRSSEQRLSVAKDAAEMGIHVYDVKSGQVLWDERIHKIWGTSPHEPVNYDVFLSGLHPDDREATTAAVDRALDPEHEGRFYAEYRVIHRTDRKTRWVAATGAVTFEDGEAVRLIGTVQDITQQRETESFLKRQNRYLEEEDRRKELFLATIGHELRNPIAALDGAVKVLEAGAGDLDAMKPVFSRQVNQLSSLINNLLDVSRVTRGKVSIARSRMDMAQTVRAAAASMRSAFESKDLDLSLVLPEQLHVHADRTRIEQVIVNLLSNACKYTQEGGKVEIALTGDQEHATLRVIDDGRGISADYLESIFEPFIQVTPGDGGLGLGLPLIRGIVSLHDGTVIAESEGPGKGATFTVAIPTADDLQSESQATLPATPNHDQLAGARILVVDDVQDTADTLAMLLETCGAKARAAYTAGQALDTMRHWQPQIALVDIKLPDMSGYEVARRVRADPDTSELLLLAVTGFGDSAAEENAHRAGFDHRLVKPVDHQQLLEILTSHVDAEAETRKSPKG